MITHSYTFTFINPSGEIITTTHNISDETFLGIGFGVFIFNKTRNLIEDNESIKVDGNVNLVHEMRHDALMPEGWEPEDYDEDIPEKYIIRTNLGNSSPDDLYATFKSPDFIQGVHTAFNWLNAPDLYVYTREIYDTETKQRIIVD
jgi:hypothetical protein